MRIKRLRMRNFRNHQDTEIDLDKVNIFVGLNGAGKTSIRGAIEFALTGKTPWLNRSLERLIRQGEERAMVELELDGIGTITRTIPHGLSVAGWNGTIKMLQQAIYDRLGINEDTLRAVLNTNKFIDLAPADQQAMLFALMGMEFTGEQIRSLIDPSAHNVFDELFPDDFAGGAEVFDACEKKAREVRRDAKKAVKNIVYESLPTLPEGVWPEGLEVAQEQLARLREQRDDLLARIASVKEILNQRQEAEAQIAEIEAEVQKSEAELYALPVQLSADVKKNMEAEVEKLDGQIESLSLKAAELEKTISIYEPEVARIEKNLRYLAKDPMMCPLISQPCKMSKSAKSSLQKSLKESLTKTKTILEKAKAERDQLPDLDALREQRSKLRQELLAYADAETRFAVLKMSIEHGKEQIKRHRDRLLNAQDAFDIDDLQRAVAALNERIARGEKVVEGIRDYIKAQERNAQKKVQSDTMLGKIESLEYLVKAFGAGEGSIRKKLLAPIISQVEEKAQKRFQQLTGGTYSLFFNMDNEFEIIVHKGDLKIPLDLLSTSERMRVGIILQDVLSSLTDLKILIVDDGESLDIENRKLLSKMVYDLKDEYDTILVFAAQGETAPSPSPIPDLAVFQVENGAVIKL